MLVRFSRLIPWLVVAAGAGGILLATLHPAGKSISPEWSWALTSGEAALAELLQNLILFIPFGIGLALCGLPILRAAALGAVLSFSVEFAQQWIPGRDPSVGDVVCNTISTALGVGLAQLAPRWLTVSPARGGKQALGAAVAAVLVWFGTAAALQPTFGPSPYQILARPDFNYWGRYRGAVLEATMQPGLLYVKATFPPRPPRRPSPLAAILDARGNRATILSIADRDLSMRYHTPAVQLRLEHPDLRWEHALTNIAPGDTFTASTGHESGRLCLAIGTNFRCNLGYTIGDGWRLIFNPEHWPDWLFAIINACWVAGWTIGVGFWAGRTSGGERSGGERSGGEKGGGENSGGEKGGGEKSGGEKGGGENGGGEGRRKAAKIAVALVLLGMIIVPMTTHLQGSSLLEWIGALVGIELGLVLGSRTWNESRYGAGTIRYTPPV
jgi:VanZ like family